MGVFSASGVEAKPGRGKFSRFFRWALWSAIVACIAYYFICGMTYSEGSRSGVLTKISKRGYVFKTYEGDMNIGGMFQGDGTIMPLSVYHFSVQDENVYLRLQSLQGKKVVIYYQEKIHAFFWQGETDYFVYKADHIQ